MNNEKYQLPLFKDQTQLPTGKNHVSYSEIFKHLECSWAHKLVYIDKLPGDPPNEFMEFGQACHDGAERFLLHHHEFDYDHSENILTSADDLALRFDNLGFEDKKEAWEGSLRAILEELPDWMNETFPGWKTIAAEYKLFEPISGQTNKYLKGFIDCVIKVPKQPRKGSKPNPNKPIEWEYWVLDFKTTSWGWGMDKKTDFKKQLQLVLYKHYLCELLGLDIKNVKCAFVLCKRTAKPNKHLEKVPISVGAKTIQKGLETQENVINSIMKGFYKKNRNSCTYCKYKNTIHCP